MTLQRCHITLNGPAIMHSMSYGPTNLHRGQSFFWRFSLDGEPKTLMVHETPTMKRA
jgi:hypothetical protein